jgi:tRNA (mo5U34)-methyltransferase
VSAPAVAEPKPSDPWYHTLDLGGDVVTNGLFDLRGLPESFPLPASLAGKRCLDVGSADGFWAFELERRGAAEVVSLDLEDTTKLDIQGGAAQNGDAAGVGLARRRFEVAKRHFGSKVERVDASIYEISKAELGEFDLVLLGNLLVHLRDPVRGLMSVREVVRGELVSFEPVSIRDSLLAPRRAVATLSEHDPVRWWMANLRGHRRLVSAAGFRTIEDASFFRAPFGPGYPRRPPSLNRRNIAFWLFIRPYGLPSQWVRARP